MKMNFRLACYILAMVHFIVAAVIAQAEEDLAKQSQNPLGTIISSPFENNLYFGIGPSDATAYALTWKPVYPVDLGNWNLINRFIIPAVYGEGQDSDILLDSTVDIGNESITSLPTGSAFGLADITYTAYFSPKSSGSWIWGIGGALGLPTITLNHLSLDLTGVCSL